MLIDLTNKEKIGEEDEKIILKIYQELNNHLNPENNNHLISEEEWWNDFISKPIFWTDKEEFWKNDNDVFVNDNQELYELFKEKLSIAFLKLRKNYHPKIQYFIKDVNISYLSKEAKIEPVFKEEPTIEHDLTNYIQDFVPYILRYLYQLANPDYERLKRDDILMQLKNLICYSVKSLKVKYSLGSEFTFAERNFLLDKGNLYIQKDKIGDTDHLAIEFAKLFGDIRGLDHFLILLFDKKTKDKIENFLSAKGIQELPNDEQEWYKNILSTTPEEVAVGEKDEQKIIEPPPSEAVSVDSQTEPGVTPETPESQVPPIEIRLQGVKTDWSPAKKPTDTEVHIEQFQTAETGSKATKDKPHERGIDIGKTPRMDEEKQDRDTLSPEAKKAIGRWGEEYALKCLKDELSKKYSNGETKENEDGFIIICGDQTYIEVHWLNKKEDKGEGYDIKVIENNNEKYIEVKSTTTDDKEWFDISKKQWELIQEMEENFHIYRVYNAGTAKPKLLVISNPKKLWQEGALTAYLARIQI